MYKLLCIAKNNMKRQKGDMITFVILTFISAFLIVNCFTVLTGLGKVLDTDFEKMNGAHILFWVGDSESERNAADQTFRENRHLKSYEVTPRAHMAQEYRNASEEEFSSFEFIIESFEENPSVMKVEKPDKMLNKNDVLIPYNLKSRFEIGDELQIRIGEKIFSFNVAGYTEDPYFCSTLNISMHSIYMSDEMIDALCNEPKGATHGFFYKGIADDDLIKKDGYSYQDMENEIGDEYKINLEKFGPDRDETGVGYILLNWGIMREGSKILPSIVMAVIAIFSILILLIALIIISFSIKNFIQKNMKNTGILEASGYTVTQLRWALTFQITITAALGTILGIVLAIVIFPKMGDIYSMVVGLSWNQPLNPLVIMGAFLGLVFIVFIVARFTSCAYKKITVLDALRGGINAHNYKKNMFSFEKTPLPISIVLSLKETFGGIGKTIVMALIVMILSVVALVGFGMKENFGGKPEGLINLMGFEMADMLMETDSDIAEDLRADEGIENVLQQVGFEPNLTFNGKTAMYRTYALDDFKYTTNTIILEGRMPENDNEMMVTGAVAGDFGLKTGDVVEVSMGSEKAEFIIVGLHQKMEQYGRSMYMTIEGCKRIIKSKLRYRYGITAKKGISYDELKSEIERIKTEKGFDFECIDLKKQMYDTIDNLTMTMKMICAIITVLTILIVIFVESLVIRAKLAREWRGMGISKALGETGLGLISQIMLSNIPAVLIGGIIGACLAQTVGSVGCRVIFASFGIKKVDFDISFVYVLITVVGISIVAVLASALAGLKVRRLNPIELIAED